MRKFENDFLDICATCSELQSDISTMTVIERGGGGNTPTPLVIDKINFCFSRNNMHETSERVNNCL